MGTGVPDTAVDEVGTVVYELFATCVLHTNLHEFLVGGVVTVVPVLQLVEVGLDVAGYPLGHQSIIIMAQH